MKECSSVLRNQVKRQEALLANNFIKLKSNIQDHVTYAKNRLSDNNAVLERKMVEKNYLLQLMEKIRYTEAVILKACNGDGSNNGSSSASRRNSSCSCIAVEEDSMEFKCLHEAYFGSNDISLLKHYLLRPSSSSLFIPTSSSSRIFFLPLSLPDLSLVLDGGWTALAKTSPSSNAYLLSASVDDSIRSFTSHPPSSSIIPDPSTSTASPTGILYTVLMCSMGAPFEDLCVNKCGDRLSAEAILICSRQQPFCDGNKMSFLLSRLEKHSHGLLHSASEPQRIISSIDILSEYQGNSPSSAYSRCPFNFHTVKERLRRELSLYVDNLLQEVTVEKSDLLRYAQTEVEKGEEAVRQVHGSVEKERKHQESLLRSIKR